MDLIEKVIEFIENVKPYLRDDIRAFGIDSFSLEKSATSYLKSLNSEELK